MPGPRIHAAGDFYDLEGFKAGGVRLRPYEIEMVGDVAGKSLLHLQCHFGIDTLSWARLGARVTGADLSPAAIELARSLAVELGFPEARFVESNLYDLPAALDGEFDVVYTSRGVLGWLPDIRALGAGRRPTSSPRAGPSSSPRPPGHERLRERGRRARRAAARLPVLGARGAADFEVKGSYADPATPTSATRPSTRWDHGLGEIVTALIDAGLRDRDARRAPVPRLEGRLPRRRRDGTAGVLPPDAGGELPLMFSLVATKPA